MPFWFVSRKSTIRYNIEDKLRVVIVMIEVNYEKIGQRIRKLRLEKGLTQADLSAMVNCSNNYLSHIETAQCKLSLSMLLRLASALGESTDYFLLDTPYAHPEAIISRDIAAKLEKCNPATLVAVSKMIDTLLEQQKNLSEDD